MRRLLFGSSIFAFALSLAACGSDSTSAASSGASTGATTEATTGTSGTGGSGGTSGTSGTGGAGGSGTSSSATSGTSSSATSGTSSSASGGTTSSTSGTGGAPPVGPEYKSYVILGDSISDNGGVGPFFYNILATNDDAAYPQWQGKDLKTRYGQGLTVVSTSKGGAVSANVLGQVQKLPATLPGPVAVTITIGGNDMQSHIINILNGADQADRDAFRANIKASLTELTKPDRFGPGVEVHVFQANIYDPTDGTGNFSSCPFPLNQIPKQSSAGFFMNWNAVVTDEVPKYGVSLVEPLHKTFAGHGVVNAAGTWYAKDCIHPNKIGHNEIRAMFWTAITGEAAPL